MEKMKENITQVIKKSSVFLLLETVLILIITTLLFLVKITITPWHLGIISVITFVIYWKLYIKENKKINTIAVILALIIFAGVTFIEGKVYDSTADGNTYHKLAIGCMKNGWNPCYESSEDFNKEQGNVFDTSDENINTLWIDHYAKATEIFGAVVYSFTGNIECGKAYTLILMYSAFGIIFAYLYDEKKRSLLASIIVSVLLVFNAITVVQIFNYYVDGALMISILMIIFSLIRECENNKEDKRTSQKENLIILACNIILCINIKFTGVAFAAVYCFAFYVYWLIKSYRTSKEEFKKQLKTYTIFYIITVVVSIVIVGFSSYTKNFIDHGHPLYPLYGEGHVANMVVMEQPSSFNDKSHLEIFLISIFSKGENVSPTYSSENIQPTLKMPFTILDGEIKNYSIPDIRVGGFGPLFSVVFIASIIGTIYIIASLIKNKKWNMLIPYGLILGITAILILALDGNYWARYIPYFYSIPMLVLSYLLWNKDQKLKYILGIILSIVMFVNVSLVTYTTLINTKNTDKYIGKHVNEFINYYNQHAEEGVEIRLNHMGLQGVLYNLDDLGIDNYRVNKEAELTQEGFMFNY